MPRTLKTEEAVEVLRVITANVKLPEFHFLTKPVLQTTATKQTIEDISTSLHSLQRNINFKAKLGPFKCKSLYEQEAEQEAML